MPPKASPTKDKKKEEGRRRKVKAKKITRFTIEELNQDIEILLNTYNPYMSEKCVEFDRKTRTFKPILDYRKPVTVLKYQGTMRKKRPVGVEILFSQVETDEKEGKMRNKFNYRSVASQTDQINLTEQGNQIDPSLFPVLIFQGIVSKFEITEAYKNLEKKKDKYCWMTEVMDKIVRYVGRKATPFQDSSRRYLRLCERMVDQNLTGANLDYSYYDNPSDEFRPDFGSLLPLWIFSCGITRGLPVTCTAWSLHFSDLFAVGYSNFKEEEGDEDDMGIIKENGYVCVYSLKGPNFPEKIIECQSGVQCLSFHPGWPHLLAVGCKGGTLNVFDLRSERNEPAGTNKLTEKIIHRDTVNEVKWLPDVLPQKFCTVSTDGSILIWDYMLHDLFPYDDVVSLFVKDYFGEVPPRGIEVMTPTSLHGNSDLEKGMTKAGLSMCVNPCKSNLLIVGTDTGVIYECSFDDKKQLESYEDHKHSVGRVHWNPYHPRVFLSCGDDMTVRIWDHSMRESIFEFFFENEVKDACWAPFSSTLFAVITGNAVLFVFDIAVNKKEAIGTCTVYTAKNFRNLTTVCFHPSKPIIIVGDEKGHVHSYKLSPNLRSSLKGFETLEKSKFIAGEEEKMEKLLAPAKGRIRKNNR